MTIQTDVPASISRFRDCRFFSDGTNKIEKELQRGTNLFGDYYYDFVNFSVVEQFVAKGSTCFDIGANIGVYSNTFAQMSGDAANVHSFEPVRHIRHKLLANAKLNGNMRLNVNDFALGDVETKMTMFQIKPGLTRGGVSSLLQNDTYHQIGAEHYDEVEVNVVTLDRYVREQNIQNIDFIKIDVEGFEMNVLRGGRETIAKHRPFVLLELDFDRHGRDVAAEMADYFRMLDYRAYDPERRRRGLFGSHPLQLAPYAFTESPKRRNLLLVP